MLELNAGKGRKVINVRCTSVHVALISMHGLLQLWVECLMPAILRYNGHSAHAPDSSSHLMDSNAWQLVLTFNYISNLAIYHT